MDIYEYERLYGEALEISKEIAPEIFYYYEADIKKFFNQLLEKSVNLSENFDWDEFKKRVELLFEHKSLIVNDSKKYLETSAYAPYLKVRWESIKKDIIKVYNRAICDRRLSFNTIKNKIEQYVSCLVEELDIDFELRKMNEIDETDFYNELEISEGFVLKIGEFYKKKDIYDIFFWAIGFEQDKILLNESEPDNNKTSAYHYMMIECLGKSFIFSADCRYIENNL